MDKPQLGSKVEQCIQTMADILKFIHSFIHSWHYSRFGANHATSGYSSLSQSLTGRHFCRAHHSRKSGISTLSVI